MVAMTDDEQKEQLKSFAKRYGSPIVTGVLLALCVFFGWQWWHKKQDVTSSNLTVQYQDMMEQATTAAEDEASYKQLSTDANKLVAENPESVQALQTQLLLAKLAFDKKDYETANKVLTQASNSKVKDEGLKSVVKLHLAYTQVAQDQLDAALKTLDSIKNEAFVPSVQEAKGDILVSQNKLDAAKKAYQLAWDALAKREQPRELLQMKLANLGVLVEEPEIESPILTAAPSLPQPTMSEQE